MFWSKQASRSPGRTCLEVPMIALRFRFWNVMWIRTSIRMSCEKRTTGYTEIHFCVTNNCNKGSLRTTFSSTTTSPFCLWGNQLGTNYWLLNPTTNMNLNKIKSSESNTTAQLVDVQTSLEWLPWPKGVGKWGLDWGQVGAGMRGYRFMVRLYICMSYMYDNALRCIL